MGWEALGRWFESSAVAFLFLLSFSYFFFSVEVKSIFTFTILSVSMVLEHRSLVRMPGTTILS